MRTFGNAVVCGLSALKPIVSCSKKIFILCLYSTVIFFIINAFKIYIYGLKTITITTTSTTTTTTPTTAITNFCGTTAHSEPVPPHYRDFTITLRHTKIGRTRLDEWLAGLRSLYLSTNNTQKR